VRFPDDYESEEWIWASKGYLVIEVHVQSTTATVYVITIRDSTRLHQDVEAELAGGGPIFAEPNVVIVLSVNGDRSSARSRSSREGAFVAWSLNSAESLVDIAQHGEDADIREVATDHAGSE
jgi:hypothetical protein